MREFFSSFQYIKQTDRWAKFLETLGWVCFRTKSGALVVVRRFIFFGLAKVQRPKPLSDADLRDIREICKKNKVFLTVIEPSFGQDMDLLKKHGYKIRKDIVGEPSIMVMDLRKTEEELWKEVSKSGKYGTNRAQREGSKVDFYINPSDEKIKLHNTVCKESGKRNGFGVPSYREVLKKVRIFGEEAFLSIVTDGNDVVLGTKLFLGDRKADIVFYDGGGTSDAGRDNRAGFDLMWQSILFLKKQGYTLFDLGGAYDDRYETDTKKWKGFTDFKAKFGGEILKLPPVMYKLFY